MTSRPVSGTHNEIMKITKSQLKQIIYHEIKRSLNESNGDKFRQNLLKYFPEKDVSGAVGEKPVGMPEPAEEEELSPETIELPPEQHDAWLKLREVLTLIERAGMNVISKGKEEQKYSPVQVVKLVQGIVGAPQTQDAEEVTRLLQRFMRDEE